MLRITIDTEREVRHVRPSAEELAALVRRIGADGDRYLVMSRLPEVPEFYAQVWHETGAGYELEYREGAADRHYRTLLEEPETVAAALAGWARQEPGWGAGLEWTLCFFNPEEVRLDLNEEDSAALVAQVREALAGGYRKRAELIELAEEYLVTDGVRPVSHAQARALVDRLWRERLAEQAGWEGETDPERLTRAFAALAASGITAREDYTCCRTCGNAEIGEVREPGSHGFVYFHSQGTEHAVTHGKMALYFGGFDGSEKTTLSVGREVVSALHAAGLTVDWNGEPDQAIQVSDLTWRRRLPEPSPNA